MVEKTYFIDIDISPEFHDDILKFIYKNYQKTKSEYFKDIKIIKNDLNQLYFTVKDPKENFEVKSIIKSGNPIEITLIHSENTPNTFLESVADDIFFMAHLFEENIHNSTIYFSWVEGEKIIPEEPPTRRKRMLDRFFGSSMLLIYVLFFGVNIILFLFIGLYAVILILLIQLLIVLFADKILEMRSNWRITPQNPYVHILEYQLPFDEFKEFREKFGKKTVIQIKKEIYDKTLGIGTPPTCESGDSVLEKYGFHCNPYSNIYKVINVYDIVKKAADSFNLPVPKIVVTNTMIPNAAATGPSPKRGLVLITTGLLVQLDENEILSVIGHEMGHLQGRDPLILFSIISGEFLLRFTLLLPIVLISPLLYVILAMVLIFFVAKFFETRADLLSAMKIGQPDVLAKALRKIAYKRLQLEKVSGSKIPRWLAWDPHPPLYFRINRLENMKTPVNIKNPLIQSVKDVLDGFISILPFKKS